MGAEHVDDEEYADWVQDAIDEFPPNLAEAVSNLEVLIENRDPAHPERLGLYQGVPLTRRSRGYVWALPDRITIYRGSIERFYGRDRERLKEHTQHVVRHEFAHHFGISDARLLEMGRY